MRTTKPIFLCASQSSTAICMSMDHHHQASSSSSSSSVQLGGRAIDRHNPIIRDGKRFITTATAPCSSSQLPPINPKPYHQLPKTNNNKKKNSSSSSTNSNKPRHQTKKSGGDKKKKKSTSDGAALKENVIKPKSIVGGNTLDDFITPPGSTRYLLSDTGFVDGLSDYDLVSGLVPVESKKQTPLSVVNYQDESTVASKLSSYSSRSEKPNSNQVVVLRVSLHCKGCAGKLRKHLSKMEGVTSFNIDFTAKKVTVVGDVTPLSVLASVSKVKNAQFWPPAQTSSTTLFSGTTHQEIKK